jgi:hypothetical protein
MRISWLVLAAVAVAPSSALGYGPHVYYGDVPSEWKSDSVAFAEILDVRKSAGGGRDKVLLRPIGTLSGRFDASTLSDLTVEDSRGWGATNEKAITKGRTLLVVLEPSATDTIISPPGLYVYMPSRLDPLAGVDGFADPWVADTLQAIQDVREDERNAKPPPGAQPHEAASRDQHPGYWSAHAVVFAEVRRVRAPMAGKVWRSLASIGVNESPVPRDKLSTVFMLPKLTLAGAFDAGLTPEVAAAADLKTFGPLKPLAAGDKVLVVLERVGNSYRVAQELPEYMPNVGGKRSPICVVKDFSDPKVTELVKSLKDLRKRQRDAEAKKKPDDKGKK